MASFPQRRMMQGAGVNAPGNPMQPAGGANPMAQQLAARGVMPNPVQGGGPVSTLGAAAPRGMMPPGGPAPGPPPGSSFGPMAGGPPPGGPPPQASMGPGGNPQAAQQQLAALMQARGAGAPTPVPGFMAKGGRVRTFNSTKAAPGNLPTRPGKAKMAEGGAVSKLDSLKSVSGNLPLQKQSEPLKKAKGGKAVLRRKPAAHKERKAADTATPAYDRPSAGDDGWPPTPSFTGAPGPNAPAPVPAPAPQAAAPAMAKGGKVEKKAKGGKCDDKDKDGMNKGGACDKMAAGGVAKVRRGFPDTIKAPSKKKFATGGSVRGGGAAQRGMNFSGIY